ncbi:hypothetical protein LY90DRAFT_521601 [Neocallimastix californiae]|uniref:Uncharacterized protein n=1 Tax=Neocallimastix californiae TaxID=1754190 RepID=A0A1Y1XAB2_9FUNG|nr:hypothetical protein LY90DRAFT_521601 [Neocallimastix californiae]|eukprot:ORX82711.1 hypothetical protein LY90DRAFT_521601 [Neocallimastix californiae]
MNVGYYSIDNTETNGKIPTTDYPTTYNIINRFQSVLTNPKVPISNDKIKWEDISNIVVDGNGNIYYLLKLDVNNTTYLKIIVVGMDGKLLVQHDIDHEFKNLDLTQRNLIYLLGNDRSTVAVIVNDNETNVSGLEVKSITPKTVKRDAKDDYININIRNVPYEPRISNQGSSFYALIQPSNDSYLSSQYPCLFTIQVNKEQVKENCNIIKNKEVNQFLPSLQAKSENSKDDVNFHFATDYDVFSSSINNTVEDPSIMNYLGSNVKIQRFDWSSPDFYYATDDGIGFYSPNKDAMKSSINWYIHSRDLPKNYSSSSTDFVAYSTKEKHLFICVRENDQGENGHIAIIDTETKKVYEDDNVPCSKESLILLADKNFISSTRDGVNFYNYDDKNFNVKKVKSIPAAASSFVSAPVFYNDRLYVNGNVLCNDTLSKDIFNGNIYKNSQDIKEEDKHKDSLLKPIFFSLGMLALVALLISLLLIAKKRRNRKRNEKYISRKASDSIDPDYVIDDDDFDFNLNVGVRNSTKLNQGTLTSKHSYSSKYTVNSHISQRSLIKKTKSDEQNDDHSSINDNSINNAYLYKQVDGDINIRNYPRQEYLGHISTLSLSPIKEDVHYLSPKRSGLTNDSNNYRDINENPDLIDVHENYSNQASNASDNGYLSEMNTTLINSSNHRLSPTTTNETTFVASDKLTSPSYINQEESMSDIIPPTDIIYKDNKVFMEDYNNNQHKNNEFENKG